MSEWRPISEYDDMNVKPKHCVFWVQAVIRDRGYTSLPASVVMERHYGRRVVTHFRNVGSP
jgi:hypothetical protein